MKTEYKNIKTVLSLFILIFIISGTVTGQEKSCTDCHSELIKQKLVHAAAEDCSSCHSISSNSEHFDTKDNFSLNDKMPDLCYMCHESKNTKKNLHVPAAEGECAVCHSPHSSDYSYLLKENPVSKLCFECHDSEITNNKTVHLPVKQGNCEKCHDAHESDYPRLLKTGKPELCFNCHEKQKKESESENIHPPFDDDCSNCHTPHNSQYKSLLNDKTPTLCFNCHEGEDKIKNSLSVHKVLTDKNSCSNCHSPHASNKNYFLKEENNELCFSCHNRTIKTEYGKIENLKQKINTAKSIHPPIEIDGCGSCHSPHYSDNPYLLLYAYPQKKYAEAKTESFALCFECHDSDLLTQKNTESATNFRNGNKNMHYLHIKGNKGRSCSLCHDIHASGNEKLIKEKSRFGTWEMNMNFKVLNNGGSCFPGCHGQKSYIRK